LSPTWKCKGVWGVGGRGHTTKGEGGKGDGATHRASGTSDVDALFKLPLAEFTSARNALSTTLKKSGRQADAEAVKALPKPSIPAWVVNQLYWRHRHDFDRLINAGEEFRKAQATHLAGKSTDVREPLNAHREALSTLAKVAAEQLRAGGYSATPEMMRRVTTTLEALSTYGAMPDAPRAGRLTDDVAPPGFETLAALVPRVGQATREHDGPTHVLPFRQETHAAKARAPRDSEDEERRREEARKAEVAAARAAVQDGERTLRDARKGAELAEAALKKAATLAKESERERLDLAKTYEKLVAAADAAKEEAHRVAGEAEEAAQAVADAERALDQARRRLNDLV
jgi:hypothetical protein